MSDEDEKIMYQTWKTRDVLYRQLFGPHKFNLPKVYAPPTVEIQDVKTSADIAAILGTTISENDITIMVYEPNDRHPYWMYVTSGLSNPWFGKGDGEVAGFGHELVLKTKTPGRWQFRLLRRLASYVLTYSGTLQPGVMLEFDMPLFYSGPQRLDGVMIWYVDEAQDCIYELPNGRFGVISVLGILSDEAEFVRSFSDGTFCMQQLLRHAGYGQVTDPMRDSIMSLPEIKEKIYSLRSYASLFTPEGSAEQ